MEFRAARRSERDEVLDLLALWYNDRAFFALYNQNDPTFRDDLCLVAVDNGRIVSTVQIFDRRLNFGGAAAPMGGIGSVFTREDYRHRRVASELMRLAVATMERERFELSLLFAERLTFYNQFGWREVGRKFSVLAQAAQIAAPRDIEIDIFDAARDLEAIAVMHRNYSGRFNVTAVRDIDDWRANLIFAGNQPLHPGKGSEEYFVIARRSGGAPIAYARITRFHGVAMVMEYGYEPESIEAMLALFRHLGEVAIGAPSSFALKAEHRQAGLLKSDRPDAAPGVIITHTAHDPALEERLRIANCPVMHHADNFYMWRVISPSLFAKRLDVAHDRAEQRMLEVVKSDASLFWTSDRF
jgi:predicted N-acetyltransferase YhbS